jgi:4-amino-4-deoxy-L-arabinose transferase-like glycosyltransferase
MALSPPAGDRPNPAGLAEGRGPWDRIGHALRSAAVGLTLILLATLIPRVVGLGQFATADEYLWVRRSANFYCAISQGDWAGTFQRQHPGVTTTWAGLLSFLVVAPDYASGCQQVDNQNYEQILRGQGIDPLALLRTGRLFMVLFSTCALAIGYLYARRLIGPWPALAGCLLVAFDPFHIAHSRLLHLDGLLGSLMLVAVLAFSSYLRRRRLLDLAVSGVATALSCLTKSPGILLLPFIGLAELISYLSTRRAMPFGAFALWGAVAAVTFVALWPAMWVQPIDTVYRIADLAGTYASEGHSNPLFFNGTVYTDGNIGSSVVQFYPLTYLWRSTPVTLLGLLAALLALVFRRDLLPAPSTRRTAIELFAFSVVVALALDLSAKKFDRYLLPAYAPLDLVAGVGWIAVLRWLRSRWHSTPLCRAWALVPGLAIVLQIGSALHAYPYYLTYYNPLMGGSKRAPEAMMVGWGEGLEQAARYLNEQPDAKQLHVLSWYEPGCFSYFFEGSSAAIPNEDLSDADLQGALNADYVVLYYAQQVQRRATKELITLLDPHPVAYSVWIDGIEYVRVYRTGGDVRTEPAYQPVDRVLEDRIRLEGYSVYPDTPLPGQGLVVSLAWEVLRAPEERLKVFVQLLDSSGRLVAQHDGEPVGWQSLTDAWQAGDRYTDRHGVLLPPEIPPGDYRLQVGMYRYSGDRLQMDTGDGTVEDAIRLGTITILDSAMPPSPGAGGS